MLKYYMSVYKFIITVCDLFAIGSKMFEHSAIISEHTLDVAHESWKA